VGFVKDALNFFLRETTVVGSGWQDMQNKSANMSPSLCNPAWPLVTTIAAFALVAGILLV
jgi:hypothetical protein